MIYKYLCEVWEIFVLYGRLDQQQYKPALVTIVPVVHSRCSSQQGGLLAPCDRFKTQIICSSQQGGLGRGKDEATTFYVILPSTWKKKRNDVGGVSVRGRNECSVSKGMRGQWPN